ncbi:MAG: hypothetical protein EOO12_15255 [Chitinophagaceae bacterium]|nr:MAG: hypothetical protein EOO12_15255 [Chitinophagaceae bacterium]
MNTRKILIVSAHREALERWPSYYEPVFAETDESAIEVAQRQPFEAIVLDGTDPEVHSAKLRAILPILQPEAALFNYEGAPEATVQADVQEYFRRQRNARIRRFIVLDNAGSDWTVPPEFSEN